MNEQQVNGSGAATMLHEPMLPEQGLKFTLEEVPNSQICIKVVGIGGCGGNIVDHMIESGLGGFEYICINTDEQALNRCTSPAKLQIGKRVTQGYGTGSNPALGREAALENTEELSELIGEGDMVFLVLGLGGGTGTGAAPVIGSLAKQVGALTIAAAVKPFAFEGKHKNEVADEGFEAVLEQVDTAIEIPNERLMAHMDSGGGFFDGFRIANNLASEMLEGITDIINKAGIMNSDFADIRAVLEEAGLAVVGSGQATGPEAAVQAARGALDSLMVEQELLSSASKVLVNITGSEKFGMHDASDALHLIQREFHPDANLIIGTVRDESFEDQVKVMVVASGFTKNGFELRPVPAVEVEEPFEEPTATGFEEPAATPYEEAAATPFEEATATPYQELEPQPLEPSPVPVPEEVEAPHLPVVERPNRHELPQHGESLGFGRRAPILAEESVAAEPEPQKPGFFRRKRSIFG